MTDLRELSLGQRTAPVSAQRRGVRASAWTIALAAHVALLAVVIALHTRPLKIGTPNSVNEGIGAFVLPGGAPAPAPRPRPVVKPRPAQPAPAATSTQDTASDASTAAEGTSGQGAGTAIGSGGPVRLTQGVDIQLLKRVVPQYPAVMRAAGLRGVVVLDATILRDGTIGDIEVLQSSGPAFAQAAIAAVKQWQYSPIPYEGVLTVTLNFNLT